MVVDLGVDEQQSGTAGTVAFDVAVTDLNDDQDIAEPSDAKPFDELLGQLGGLGIGGGALGGSGDDSAASGAGSSEDLEQFSQCITKAGEDVEKARKCSDLLNG
jgi:hypothetical protein